MQPVEQKIDFRCDAECRATVHITSEPWGPRVSWAPIISPDGPDEHDRVRQGARARRASVGVNPADTYMRSGTYAIVPQLPYTPGGDAGGVIFAIGPGVSEHKLGNRVCVGTALSFDLTGCYAEKVKRRASEVLSLAESISFAEAATFGVSYPTAHYALFARGDAQGSPPDPNPVAQNLLNLPLGPPAGRKRYYGAGGETVLRSSLRSMVIDGASHAETPRRQ